MMKKFLYNSLVGIQFFCIFYIMLSGEVIIKAPPLLIIELLGLITGFWSVFAIKIGNFNISPEVKTGGKMISRGPYKIIRHPMYLSILLFLIPMVIYEFTWVRLIIMLALGLLLVIKIFIEEKLMMDVHAGYEIYRKKTWRLIPFIF